jgi:hypothetical protein
LAAAAFIGGQSRLKAGSGQNCPPSRGVLSTVPHRGTRVRAPRGYYGLAFALAAGFDGAFGLGFQNSGSPAANSFET